MKKILLAFLVAVPFFLNAQDTATFHPIKNELGVNTVLLIKQLVSNNPSQTLNMLPYQLIYTRYLNNKYGIRAGIGITQSNTKTRIEGNSNPRETSDITLDARLGGNRQLISHKKISATVFADAVSSYASLKTHTVSNFGGNHTVTDDLRYSSLGFGGQAGFGVKFSFNRHIALYTEVPVQVLASSSDETHNQVVVNSTIGTSTTTTISSSNSVSTQILLPTTVFLTIMF